MSLSLKEIVKIEEIDPHLSVGGETRERIYPLDRIDIERQTYIISEFSLNKKNNYDFIAKRQI